MNPIFPTMKNVLIGGRVHTVLGKMDANRGRAIETVCSLTDGAMVMVGEWDAKRSQSLQIVYVTMFPPQQPQGVQYVRDPRTMPR